MNVVHIDGHGNQLNDQRAKHSSHDAGLAAIHRCTANSHRRDSVHFRQRAQTVGVGAAGTGRGHQTGASRHKAADCVHGDQNGFRLDAGKRGSLLVFANGLDIVAEGRFLQQEGEDQYKRDLQEQLQRLQALDAGIGGLSARL